MLIFCDTANITAPLFIEENGTNTLVPDGCDAQKGHNYLQT